ncbi:MAG TPA: hypothetical protein VMP68_17205 [Candidatus Eisenbacteria bacterium]|nr:hypothetical protein [Candidatus Eisenbacteria bacterium]
MRSLKYLALMATATLVFSMGAFAKDSHSGSFDLDQTARIGSTVLQPGHYKAEWTGPNDALQISIVQHGKTIATTQGKLKQLPSKSADTAVEIRSDQSKKLDEIDFANRTQALVLSGSQS